MASSTHIALLRGINVGGKNKLPMQALRELFEAEGCSNVRTYIQSGNVVFEATAALAKRIPKALAASIANEHGLEVPVVTRSAKELRAAVDANPFLGPRADETTLHVGFLAAKPTKARVDSLDPDRSPPDEWVLQGREIYFRCPNGVARSKLTNAYFDGKLKTVSTMRNWRTTLKLLEMCEG